VERVGGAGLGADDGGSGVFCGSRATDYCNAAVDGIISWGGMKERIYSSETALINEQGSKVICD